MFRGLFPVSGKILSQTLITSFSFTSIQAQSPLLTALATPPAPISAGERAQPQVTVEGRIFDPHGLPIAGASVALQQGDLVAAAATTDEQGRFHLSYAAGSYTLTVAASGMAVLREPIALKSGASLQMERRLTIAQATSSVQVSASGYQTQEQTAASRIPIRPLDLPQTVTTISQDFLRDRAVESMQEALAYTPGVSAVLGEGRRDQFSIRGFSANTDLYLDGVKDDATYYRDLSNTDHIEVVEGPAAVLYGRGTSGGMIDRVTKKPRNEGTLAEFSTIQGGYGSKRVEGDIDTLLGSPKLGLRSTGAWEDGGSFRHFYALNRNAWAPTVRWVPNADHEVVMQFERLRDERLPDRGIPGMNGRPVPVNIANYYGWAQSGGSVPADFLHNAVSDESLDWKSRFQGWNGHEVFRHSGYQTNFQNTFSSGVSNGAVTRGEYNGSTLQENFFNQMETWKRFRTGRFENLFLVGLEYGHQHIRRFQHTGTAASVDLYNPVLTAPTLSTTLSTNNGFIGQTVGVYFQDEITLAARWKALIGARFDNYRQSQTDFRTPAASAARADNAPSPRVGLLYEPTANSTYYASWSHTFDPSGESLSLTAPTSNNSAALSPEKTDNYEIGSKHQFLGNRLNVSAALYRLERSNIKIPDYTDDPTGSTYVNGGTQRTDGFEVSASGHLTPHWRTQGGWSWMDAYYVNDPLLSSGVALTGKRAQLIPVNSGSLWQMYEWSKGFGAGLGAVAMNSRFAATDNLIRLPGYARLDATAYYRTHHWDLDAHIENLSNIRYYATAQSDAQIMPGSPIDARLTLRVKF
jgi:catecholate siderophore receptor